MNERIIKVFMASSDELAADRAVFGNLVRRMNDLYRKHGIYIELFQWEDFDAAYGRERKQEEYNEKIRESDMFLAFFHKKAGEFTVEEFHVAMDEYSKKQRPVVYTYSRNLTPEEEETEELQLFKRDLLEKMGRDWCRYGNNDTLKLHFLLQFQQMDENRHLYQAGVENSVIRVDNQPLANIRNIPFAANNKAYTDMIQRKEALGKKVERYRTKVRENPDNMDIRMDLSDALQELDELNKQFEQHEYFLFDIARMFARQSGKACSRRIMEARKLFEEGKASEANGILNVEDMLHDEEVNLNTFEKDKAYVKEVYDNLKQDIQAYLQKIEITIADESLTKTERYEQANNLYNDLTELQNKIGDETQDRTELLAKIKSLINKP